MFTIAFFAGVKAFLIYSSASSLYKTKSNFSPFNSFKILPSLEPRSPIQVPIASIRSFVEETATLLRIPASLTHACIINVPSCNSGISSSHNLLTKP